MAKYVFVSQNGVLSDRKKYALRSRSSLTQNVYFFFFSFFFFWGGGWGGGGGVTVLLESVLL